MIIDTKRGFIFVHVPKTGGQSIVKALGSTHQQLNACHEPLYAVDSSIRQGMWAFGVVRNPYERLVSLYHFMCQKTMKPSDNFDQNAIIEMGFRCWLMEDEFFMAEDKPYIQHDISNAGLLPMQRRSQSWWLDGCDCVIKFDGLEKNLNMALEAMGHDGICLTHVNKSSHDNWRTYYDSRMRDFVRTWHAEDFNVYGFKP